MSENPGKDRVEYHGVFSSLDLRCRQHGYGTLGSLFHFLLKSFHEAEVVAGTQAKRHLLNIAIFSRDNHNAKSEVYPCLFNVAAFGIGKGDFLGAIPIANYRALDLWG